MRFWVEGVEAQRVQIGKYRVSWSWCISHCKTRGLVPCVAKRLLPSIRQKSQGKSDARTTWGRCWRRCQGGNHFCTILCIGTANRKGGESVSVSLSCLQWAVCHRLRIPSGDGQRVWTWAAATRERTDEQASTRAATSTKTVSRVLVFVQC